MWLTKFNLKQMCYPGLGMTHADQEKGDLGSNDFIKLGGLISPVQNSK